MGHHNQLRIFGMRTTSHSLANPVPLLDAVLLEHPENLMTVAGDVGWMGMFGN